MREELYEILAEICEDEIVTEELDLDLFENGYLDSLGFAELLATLETQLNVVISPSELEREDFNTTNKIVCYVEARGN